MADLCLVISDDQVHTEESSVLAVDDEFLDIPDFMHGGHANAQKKPDKLVLETG